MADWRLIIETSGRGGWIGLADDGRIIRMKPLNETQRHARDLAVCVRELFGCERLAPHDMTSIVVSIGPGSYTGLRVGIASAKAFAYATGCSLFAVQTFHAVARMAAHPGGVDVIENALQGRMYVQRFDAESRPTTQLRIVKVSEWNFSPEVAISGPGISALDQEIPADIIRMTEDRRRPTAEAILLTSLNIKPLNRQELFALEPLYLRGSSAEELAATKIAKS